MTKPSIKLRVDSDIIRNLAHFSKITKEGTSIKYIDTNRISNEHIKQNFEDYLFIMDKIKSGELEIFVSKYVFREVEHIEYVFEFIQKYCSSKFSNNTEEIEKLANAYCNPYTENGEELLPPMNRQYVAAINKVVPTNDCYIMADATVNYSFLLTNNLQDYIYDKTSSNPQDHRRIDGIRAINVQHGYKRKGVNGDFIPQPMVIKKFVRYMRNYSEKSKDNLVTKKYKQNFIKQNPTQKQQQINNTDLTSSSTTNI